MLVQTRLLRWHTCRCHRDVTAAEEQLHMILLDMRKLLRLPRLEYVSIQNQADYLIEVPVEMHGVPKVQLHECNSSWPVSSEKCLSLREGAFAFRGKAQLSWHDMAEGPRHATLPKLRLACEFCAQQPQTVRCTREGHKPDEKLQMTRCACAVLRAACIAAVHTSNFGYSSGAHSSLACRAGRRCAAPRR